MVFCQKPHLHTEKIKELILDFWKSKIMRHPPIYICGTEIECASSFKFLGVLLFWLEWLHHWENPDQLHHSVVWQLHGVMQKRKTPCKGWWKLPDTSLVPNSQSLNRCLHRARNIIRNSSHPGQKLFNLLQSRRRYRNIFIKTSKVRASSGPYYPVELYTTLISLWSFTAWYHPANCILYYIFYIDSI